MKRGLASSVGSDVPREIAWYVDVRGFDPAVRQHSFMGIAVSSRAVVSYWPKGVH